MAELNPNIILAGRQPDVLGAQAQRQNIRNAITQNEANQFQLETARENKQRTTNLRDIFANTPEDQLDEQLRRGGYIEERNAMQDRRSKQTGEQLKNKEVELKNAKAKIDLTGQAMGALAQNPSIENLQSTLRTLVQNGVMNPQEAEEAFLSGPQDPEGIKALAQKHYTSALDTKEQLEKFSNVNSGTSNDTIGVNPVTGAVRTVASTPINETANNVANNERMVSEGELNRQNQREIAANKPETGAPVSVLGPDGNPVLVSRGDAIGQRPYTAKQEAQDAAKVQQKSQSELSSQQVLDQAAKLFNHKGRAAGTGMSSFVSSIPGTNAKDFQANLDTFKAQTFLPMVSALKGMGALSDAEGKRISDSVGALDPSMSEEAFADSLKEITKTLYDKAKASGLNVSLPDFANDKPKSTKKPAGYPAAKQAPDGNWYINKGGKYFKVVE